MHERKKVFANVGAVDMVSAQIVRAATECHVAILAYCFMPDHLHVLVEGEDESADALQFAHQAKQRSGFVFSQQFAKKLWQPSFHDRVLRDDEAGISVARYIVENPVRGKLVESPRDYAFLGSSRYTVDAILDAVSWQP